LFGKDWSFDKQILRFSIKRMSESEINFLKDEG